MAAALIDNARALDPADVRLVQDGRILLGAYGIAAPSGPAWDPTSDISGGVRTDLGYYGEDGFTLTPEPGDNKNFKGHNEDVVIDKDGPGTWAVAFSGIQRSIALSEAFFDTTVNATTGEFTLTKASVDTYRDLITVGITGTDVIITHYPRVKVADREAVTFGATAINALGMTFRAYRDPVLGYIAKQWDETLITTPAAAPVITLSAPASTQAAAGNVVLTGTGFAGATAVKFGSDDAASFVINSPTQITAVVPGRGAGSGNITVVTPGGTSAPRTFSTT